VGIFRKARAILLHRLTTHATDELDMSGALVFVFLLGGLHLLVCDALAGCFFLCVWIGTGSGAMRVGEAGLALAPLAQQRSV
jgi:uncharacterized membrane protein YedE/YeeE